MIMKTRIRPKLMVTSFLQRSGRRRQVGQRRAPPIRSLRFYGVCVTRHSTGKSVALYADNESRLDI